MQHVRDEFSCTSRLTCADASQATHGCGDLIFSSHTTFMLVGLLTYTEYGTRLPIKACPRPLKGRPAAQTLLLLRMPSTQCP